MSILFCIKDPIHGIIEPNELEKEIIDSADFQRLREIKQLATTYLVYPGASHTRFEHSIGTLHLASKISRALELEKDLEQKIRLFALLHDLGHTAFSHTGERILSPYLGTHEKIRKEKILNGEIGDIISSNFNKKQIADFDSSVYAQIISSDIGADRMDYLKRDAYYTGVAYGMIDEERIIHKLYFENDELGVEPGALEASESLLIARFMMFSTVYFHHTVRIAAAMLERAIELAITQGLEPDKFTHDGDAFMLAKISNYKKAAPYAQAIVKRKLYKQAYTFDIKQFQEKNTAELEKKLSSLAKSDIILNFPSNSFKLAGFKIRMHNGEKKDICDISELVHALKTAEESRKKILVLAPAEQREKVKKICFEYFKVEEAR